jgi:hypothetical protein
LVVILVGATACSFSSKTATASPKTTPSPTKPADQMDPEAPMPPGFPSDVPIYTGARLTAAAAFTSSQQTAWGMQWETLDTIDKVQAFYKAKFSQGDWSINFMDSPPGTFKSTFSRKSNPKIGGLLSADGSSGVTKISLSLLSA